MEKNSVVLNSNELAFQYCGAELPGIISEQVILLNDLDKKVKAATEQAETAKSSADLAADKSAGWFQNKEAIEAIQLSQSVIAEAVVLEAEAQKIAFEFQTQLAQITKYLFGLGVTNLGLNRSVVRELKLKLEGASAEELSDLAKQEIINVIRQLKAQEDLLQKQEELDKKIKLVHDENIRQDDLLKEQNETIIRHDKEIQEQITENNKLNEKIKEQVELYQKHNEAFHVFKEHYKDHGELLSYLAKKEEEHNKTIFELKRDLSLSLTTIPKKLMLSYTVGGIGVLLAVGTLLFTSLK